MKHKHADLIHAWADGAEIQYNAGDRWITTSGTPSWDDFRQYRIKPEEKKPVVRWLCVKQNAVGQYVISDRLLTEKQIKEFGYTHKLEWSRTEFPE